MELHNLRGNWYALKEYEDLECWSLAYMFSFGTYKLDFGFHETIEELDESLAEYGEELLLQECRHITGAMESIYTFLYESGDVVANLDILAEEIIPIGCDIYSFGSFPCDPADEDSTRLFYHDDSFGFIFDLIDGDKMVRLHITDVTNTSVNNTYTTIRVLDNLCTNKLFEIYKEDRARTHLAKYQDKYFSADLGL